MQVSAYSLAIHDEALLELQPEATRPARWRASPDGGHFPAMEVPDLLVTKLRDFFRPLRSVASSTATDIAMDQPE